jgi:hypothetical protein
MKDQELTTTKPNSIGQISQIQNAEKFTMRLHDAPAPNDVKINDQARGAKYLPISIVEMKLDELFAGLWQTKGFNYSVIANEVVGVIELGVFHPVLKEWIWRTGTAATMIQQVSKRSGGNGDITDIGQKIKNTLVKDFPHLKSECLKNAAKSLGKAFGRDLNRDVTDEYQPITEKINEADNVTDQIQECKTTKELSELWAKHPEWATNEVVMDVFIKHRKNIK